MNKASQARLKDIAIILSGYMSRTSLEASQEGTHHIILGKDFDENRQLITESLFKITPDKDIKDHLVSRGDILFQARGQAHFAYLIDTELENTVPSGSFMIIRTISKKVLPGYLTWWINSRHAQSYLMQVDSGSTIGNITKSALQELKVEIPPLPVQDKIVCVDRLLRKELLLTNRLTTLRRQLANKISYNAIVGEGDK